MVIGCTAGRGLTPTTWGRKDLGVISGGKVSQPGVETVHQYGGALTLQWRP